MFALRSLMAAARAAVGALSTDTWWKNVVFLLNGENGSSTSYANTQYRDLGTNRQLPTVTTGTAASGSVQQTSFTPTVSANWSGAFDGASYYTITSAGSVATQYTFECWFYLNAAITSTTGFIGAGNGGFNLRFNSATQIQVDTSNVNAIQFNFPTITPGVWHHLAVTRNSSNVITVFLDGTRATNGTQTYSQAATWPTILGLQNGITGFAGMLSNVRIVSGSNVYDPTATTITVPTSPLSAIQNTVLLALNDPYGYDDSILNTTLVSTGTPHMVAIGPFASGGTVSVGGSIYLNGSSYATIPAALSVNMASGAPDHTIECWIYPTTTGANRIILNKDGVSGTKYPQYGMRLDAGGLVVVDMSRATNASNVNTFTSSAAAPVNTWTHVAYSRSGSTIRVFVNGVLSGSGTLTETLGDQNLPLYIGTQSGLDQKFTGYISNLRITRGVALYTASFTPSTSPLTASANTSFLLDSTTRGLKDSSQYAVTITNTGIVPQQMFSPFTAAASTLTGSAYGTENNGSVYFDGSASYLSAPASAALLFGTGDFTIEAWINPALQAVRVPIIATANGTTDNNYYAFMISNGKLLLECRTTVGDDVSITGATTVALNTWHHVAATRRSGTVTLWLNGVADVSTANAYNFATQLPTKIGGYTISGYTGYFQGYISNVRVIVGTAQYTGTFIPQRTQLQAVSGTALLTCQSAPFADASTNAFTISSTGSGTYKNVSPLIPASVPDGYGSIYIPIASGFHSGNNTNYVTTTSSTLNAPGTGAFTFECWFNTTQTGVTQTIATTATTDSLDYVYWAVRIDGATNKMFVTVRDSNANQIQAYGASTGSTTIAANTWYHVMFTRDASNNMRVFVNGSIENLATASGGASVGTTVAGSANISQAKGITFGAFMIPTFDSYFQGYISNARFTKGTALQTAAFTVSPSLLTPVANTTFLLGISGGQPVDESGNGQTFTTVGNAFYVEANPYQLGTVSNIGSMYCPGAAGSNFIGYTATADFSMPANFTAEAWVYATATPANGPGTIFDARVTNGATPWVLRIDANRKLDYYNGTSDFTSTGTIPVGAWTHVAVARVGTTLTFYINGVASGTATVSGTQGTTTNPLRVGSMASGVTGYDFNGYIGPCRIVKGYAMYQSNFTPAWNIQPTPFSTLYHSFGNVGVSDGSNHHSLQLFGGATVSASTKKFGTGSLAFTNAGDYMYVAANDDFGFGTGDFTIEGWVLYTASGSSLRSLFDFRTGVASTAKPWIWLNGNTLNYQVSGANVITYASMTTNTWYHIAVSRVSGNTRMFVNGSQVGSTWADATNYGNTADVVLGTVSDSKGSASWVFNGFIDDFRVTKGVGRYTGNFAAPTAAAPTSA